MEPDRRVIRPGESPTAERLNTVVHPGTGPYCLLIHGALASRSYWNENLEALAEVCTPVVVELWGHGRSPSPADEHPYTIDGYIEQFELLRAELGAERWFVIGQSMGAALALHYGLAHPRCVLAQVLTNSSSAFTDPDDWVRRNTELVKRTADQVLADGVESLRDSWINPSRSARIPEPTRATMAAEFAEHDRQGVAGSLTITNRYLALGERVLDVSHPTLLTVGVLEERFLRLMPQARRIPGIEVAEVDAAHAVNAQNGPQWNEAAVAFLDRHGGPETA